MHTWKNMKRKIKNKSRSVRSGKFHIHYKSMDWGKGWPIRTIFTSWNLRKGKGKLDWYNHHFTSQAKRVEGGSHRWKAIIISLLEGLLSCYFVSYVAYTTILNMVGTLLKIIPLSLLLCRNSLEFQTLRHPGL